MHRAIFVAALRGGLGSPKSLGIVVLVSLATRELVSFGALAPVPIPKKEFVFSLSADARALANWLCFLRDRPSQTTQKQPFVGNRCCNRVTTCVKSNQTLGRQHGYGQCDRSVARQTSSHECVRKEIGRPHCNIYKMCCSTRLVKSLRKSRSQK